jgi:hypothetical protein
MLGTRYTGSCHAAFGWEDTHSQDNMAYPAKEQQLGEKDRLSAAVG